MLDLKQNYFSLFSLQVSFEVDSIVLTENYRSLLQAMHPDRFAAASAQEKRFSMQAASHINQAHQVLGSDLKRANYLLSLNNIDIDSETDTKVDPMFLMSQIEYRERLENVEESNDPFVALDGLREALIDDISGLKNDVSTQFSNKDFTAVRDTVRKWQFLDKLKQEINDVEQQLEDQLDA